MNASQIAAALRTAYPAAIKITPTGTPDGRSDWLVTLDLPTLDRNADIVVDRAHHVVGMRMVRGVERAFRALRAAEIDARILAARAAA